MGFLLGVDVVFGGFWGFCGWFSLELIWLFLSIISGFCGVWVVFAGFMGYFGVF